MDDTLLTIPPGNLLLAFIPALAVIGVLYRWSLAAGTALYALARMLGQLLLIGYVLVYIFDTGHPLIIAAVMLVMLVAASWISLRPLKQRRAGLYARAVAAIAAGGGITLLIVTQGVLDLRPWYWPRYFVPLAGMIFASAMNAVSLAAERFEAESANRIPYNQARNTAFGASLIPVINSLLAVGLVSLPGMMTGQILSGVSPMVAVRYQIVVMCMLFAAAGLSAAGYLFSLRPR